MIRFWIQSDKIKDRVYIPKYYDPWIIERLDQLASTHDARLFQELMDAEIISVGTGDEIGKAAYGTGDIPFVRTSDIVNWEIKAAPKQGVSPEIYEEYAPAQDVQEGDILLVRDGTYLIGSNCFVTRLDKQLLYQSHLLKLRVTNRKLLDPHLLFLALNCRVVQRQFRSFQFTADIIDTIGRRFFDTIIPVPRSESFRQQLCARVDTALKTRMKGKAFIKHSPSLMEVVLRTGSSLPLTEFADTSEEAIYDKLQHETISSEFGGFEYYWLYSNEIREHILVPKYYEPSVLEELATLEAHCDLRSMRELRETETIEYHVGDEIGKMAYGTGPIPFIRTTDFSNWEIKHDPKQGVSLEIYNSYATDENVQSGDILLVRDGTYLVGTSCVVTKEDERCLYCGGLYKIRTLKPDQLNPFLLLGLLSSYIVKRQIRTKQFTRDVIDTIGNRIDEVVLPIPKSPAVRKAISDAVQIVIETRIAARGEISRLTAEYESSASTA